MNKYIPMLTYKGQVVDCRMIRMELEFHEMTHDQLKQLAILWYNELQNITQDAFYVDWDIDGRKTKTKNIVSKIESASSYVEFCFSGDVLSDTVYNSKTYKKYDHDLLYPELFAPDAPTLSNFRSADYDEVFAEYFSDAKSPEEIKNAILKIFGEKGRKQLSTWYGHDIMGGFYSVPYDIDNGLYFGELNIKIPLLCLSDDAVEFVRELENFAIQVANIWSNISGRIALTPMDYPGSASAHMEYFDGYHIDDPRNIKKEDYQENEWKPYHYLCGAEWFNIVSPLQRTHLPNIMDKAKSFENVITRELSTRSLVVRSVKEIVFADIDELSDIKRLLYRALYPGELVRTLKDVLNPCVYGLGVKPRSKWELLPMFPEEITVYEDKVIYHHDIDQSFC